MKNILLILLSVITISGCTTSPCRVVDVREEMAREYILLLESGLLDESWDGEMIICSINDYVVISLGPTPSSIIVLQGKQPLFLGNGNSLNLYYDEQLHSIDILDLNEDHKYDFFSFDAWDESLGAWVKIWDKGFDGQHDLRIIQIEEEDSKVQYWEDGKWVNQQTDSVSPGLNE